MPTEIRVLLLFGGRSAEHEVSILSARSVMAAAPKRIEITPMCVARDGRFMTAEASAEVLAGTRPSLHGEPWFSFEVWSRTADFDIVFPLIHGTGGEDGTLQGYLDILGLPYVGSAGTSSAIGMDKAHMKQAFTTARLPIVEYVAILESDWRTEPERVVRSINNALRFPCFVKPANCGSSVGVTKVKNEGGLADAIEFAFQFDEKVLVERGVEAREIEVSVLGNEQPQTSVAGEIVVGHDFYDYEDKYIDDKSSLIIPAKLTTAQSDEFRRLAVAAFRAIAASGFARVDFFLERGTNRIYVNEINTIPGFTNISMYPKLWEATEMKYPRLIERLIELGMERSSARRLKRESTMKWLDGRG
jgi:D-alanine-D-alanine ligase